MRLHGKWLALVAISLAIIVCLQIERRWTSQALLRAARQGDATRVQELLVSGADPNGVDEDGQTALCLAAQQPMRRILRYEMRLSSRPSVVRSFRQREPF